MIFCKVAGLNSMFRKCFLIGLQSVPVKISSLFILFGQLRSLSVDVYYGYTCVGYTYISKSPGFILIWASEEISVKYFCHFHMTGVEIVNDIHKSLQNGKEIYALPIKRHGRRPLWECLMSSRQKYNTEYDLREAV